MNSQVSLVILIERSNDPREILPLCRKEKIKASFDATDST